MAYYPQSAAGLSYITLPAGPTAGSATVVTANASANTKGSYAQIVASAAATYNGIWLEFYGGTTTAGLQYLLDVAIGAAASEVVKIPDIMFSTDGMADPAQKGTRFFPLAVPSGSRVAVRVACSTGGSNMRCGVSFVAAGGVAGIASFVNYGSASADSGGTSIDPGGAANTKGSWVELTASSSAVAQWIAIQVTSGGNSGTQGSSWYIDIGTGAGGAEVVLIPDLGFNIGQSSGALAPKIYTFLTYIAAGTRIAARASCDITDATDRLIDVSLITGTAPTESSGGGGSFAYA